MITVIAMLVFFACIGVFLVRVIGLNFSATSILLVLMLLFHGPMYLYYTRVYGPDTDFFDTIMSAAPSSAPVLATLDLAIVVTFSCLVAGVLAADFLTGVPAARMRLAISQWSSRPLSDLDVSLPRIRLVVLLALFGILLPFLAIDHQISKVFEYFTSDVGEFLKIELRRDLGGSGSYIYNLLLATALPFLGFVIWARGFRPFTLDRMLAAAVIALVLLGKAATLSKAPLAVFVLQLAVVRYMKQSLEFTVSRVLLFAGLATAAFAAMTIVALPDLQSAYAVLDFLFYRVFMIVNEGLLEYFAAVPYVLHFNWGADISWLAPLLHGKTLLPSYYLVGEVHRGVLGSTTTVMFMGDAWAEFAWGGVVVAAFLCGLLVRWIDIRLIYGRGKSIATMAGLALAHFGIFTALSTSLQTAMLTGGLLLVVPLVSLVSARTRAGVPGTGSGAGVLGLEA